MSPDIIRQLQANASAPTGGRTKWVNGKLVLDEPSASKTSGRGGTLTSLISEGGALGGAIGGAAIGSAVPVIGTAIGGVLGGALGAFGGRLAENKVRDDRLGVGDAAKEAALTGLLGAPGRTLKYGVTAAKAAKGGSSLAEALASGAKAADKPGKLATAIKSKIANVTTGIRDDAALKNFKLNDSNWISQFQKKVGEDPGAFAARVGFATSTPKEVATKFYNPLQETYTTYLQQVPSLTKEEIGAAFDKRIAEFASSNIPETRANAEKLVKLKKELLSRSEDQLSALEARSLKNEFQSAVDEKLTDSAGKLANDRNKQVADIFRNLINDKADAAGIKIDPSTLPFAGSKATTLRELGNELRGIKEFADKAAIKQNVGRGKNPIGLTSAIGATGGGAMMGIPGAMMGAGITMAANSQAGRKAEYALAKKLSEQGAKMGSPMRAGARIGAQGALGAALLGTDQSSPLEPSMSDSTQMNMNTNATPSNPNISDALSNNQNNLSSETSNPYPVENLMYDMQRDPQNADKYLGYYESLSKIFGAQNKLNTTTATQVASSANATNTLDQLEGLFSTAGGGSGKVGGSIKNALSRAGLEGNTQTYNDLSASSVSQLARALNGGGQVSDADAAVVVQALPRITDSREVAARKFAALKARLDAARQNTLMYNGASDQSAPTDLMSALGM